MTKPSENCNNSDCQRIDMTMRQASEWSRKQSDGGVLFERERIINLIGDKFECVKHDDCEPKINITCSEMYTLIKGENK